MKKNINIRLIGIAILAVAATFIGITIIYYSLFQKQVRSDLALSAKLLRDTHYITTGQKSRRPLKPGWESLCGAPIP